MELKNIYMRKSYNGKYTASVSLEDDSVEVNLNLPENLADEIMTTVFDVVKRHVDDLSLSEFETPLALESKEETIDLDLP